MLKIEPLFYALIVTATVMSLLVEIAWMLAAPEAVLFISKFTSLN